MSFQLQIANCQALNTSTGPRIDDKVLQEERPDLRSINSDGQIAATTSRQEVLDVYDMAAFYIATANTMGRTSPGYNLWGFPEKISPSKDRTYLVSPLMNCCIP